MQFIYSTQQSITLSKMLQSYKTQSQKSNAPVAKVTWIAGEMGLHDDLQSWLSNCSPTFKSKEDKWSETLTLEAGRRLKQEPKEPALMGMADWSPRYDLIATLSPSHLERMGHPATWRLACSYRLCHQRDSQEVGMGELARQKTAACLYRHRPE